MKDIKENLPLISLALITIGTVWLKVYYQYFDINIISYIDFAEIFQLQFNLFLPTIIISTVLIFQLVSLVGLIQSETPSLVDHPSSSVLFIILIEFISRIPIINKLYKWRTLIINRYGTFENNKVFSLQLNTISWALNITIILMVIALIFRNPNSLMQQLIKDCSFFLSILILSANVSYGFYHFSRLRSTESKTFKTQVVSISLFIILIGVGTIINRYKAYNTKYGKPEFEIIALLKDKPIGSDTTLVSTSKSLVYVGQTKNYLFLYQRDKDKSQIIPMSQILDLQINKIKY